MPPADFPDQAKLQGMNEAIMRDAKKEGKEGNLVMGEGGVMRLLDDSECGGDCGKYSWGQTDDEVTVRVKVPAGTKSKAVQLDVNSKK